VWSDVITRLQDTLTRSIAPQSFELYRLDRTAQRLLPQLGRGDVLVGGAVQAWLEHAEPLVIDDEAPAPAALAHASLAVRLAVANEPVGLLVVGARPEGTPYEDQDVAFVGALAGPLAAALTNTLAFEAVEKLNRELEARVQARTQELEQKNQELATLNMRKDELVATISHDFRSPLAVIRQNVQTILRDIQRMDKDDVRMFLDGIARQEDRLTALCTNLLDLARLKQKLVPQEQVDLRGVAAALVADLQGRARERGVTLALRADGDAMVAGDRLRLGQVLQNLIDNALKFTPREGRVDVVVAVDGERVAVEVADTGVGVPAEAVPRLFEPFFQVPDNRTAGQGSGLGLAIVKAVVDAHGGSVHVDSVEQRGTVFRVELPRAPPAHLVAG
jgi:signal transduction histidine kinase